MLSRDFELMHEILSAIERDSSHGLTLPVNLEAFSKPRGEVSYNLKQLLTMGLLDGKIAGRAGDKFFVHGITPEGHNWLASFRASQEKITQDDSGKVEKSRSLRINPVWLVVFVGILAFSLAGVSFFESNPVLKISGHIVGAGKFGLPEKGVVKVESLSAPAEVLGWKLSYDGKPIVEAPQVGNAGRNTLLNREAQSDVFRFAANDVRFGGTNTCILVTASGTEDLVIKHLKLLGVEIRYKHPHRSKELKTTWRGVDLDLSRSTATHLSNQ